MDDGVGGGQRIRIGGTGGADDANYYVLSVALDGKSLTLTTPAPVPATFTGVAISKLTEQGVYTGTLGHTVSYNAATGELTRNDGTSWLDSGFIEGQLIKISGDPAVGIYKIQSFSSVRGCNLNRMKLTSAGKPVSIDANPTITQWAAPVTLSTINRFQQVDVPLLADVNYLLAPGRENLKVFSKQPHTLSGIRGPLSVEGGTTNADRSLHAAVLLPGEGNGPAFGVAPQPPEWQQIDTLNIYGDGSHQDQTGILTSTALTGLSMGPRVDFSYLLAPGAAFPFGEPGVYPGGISYGTIKLDPSGHFSTANHGPTTH